MVLLDEVLNRPEYVLAGIGVLIGTVKWLLYHQQKRENEEREKQKQYVDGQVEIIKRGYEQMNHETNLCIKDTNYNIKNLTEKLDLILVDMKDDISELHAQVFGTSLPKSYRQRGRGGILRTAIDAGGGDRDRYNSVVKRDKSKEE